MKCTKRCTISAPHCTVKRDIEGGLSSMKAYLLLHHTDLRLTRAVSSARTALLDRAYFDSDISYQLNGLLPCTTTDTGELGIPSIRK